MTPPAKRTQLTGERPLAGNRIGSLRGLGVRAAVAVAMAVLAAFAVVAISQVATPGWWSQDTDAYWNAALRLREGHALYPALLNPDASDTYRYAPWFALVWMPLTYLPKVVVYAAWTVGLLLAAMLCILFPLRQRNLDGVILALLLAGLLIPAAASGNVQPLLLITLVHGVERRSGPLWIALATSLKATPILLTAVYLGRREWGRALATFILTAALVVPMLAFDLSSYPTAAAAATGPLPLWTQLVVALAAGLLALRFATTRYAWLAASIAVMIAIPRWSYYQPTFLLVGLARRGSSTSPSPTSPETRP